MALLFFAAISGSVYPVGRYTEWLLQGPPWVV